MSRSVEAVQTFGKKVCSTCVRLTAGVTVGVISCPWRVAVPAQAKWIMLQQPSNCGIAMRQRVCCGRAWDGCSGARRRSRRSEQDECVCLFRSRCERICWTEGQDKVQSLMQQMLPVVGDAGSQSGLAL